MINQRVVIIHSSSEYSSNDTPFPPVGVEGTIISPLDEYGEYDVMFDDHHCPTRADPSWVTHKSMIVFIDNITANKTAKQTAYV